MAHRRPTYQELEARLAEAEALVKSLRSQQADDSEQGQLPSASERELAAIFDGTPIPMILVDGQRRVHLANRAAAEAGMRTRDEMIGLRGGEALRCLHALDDPKGCGFGPSCETCRVRLLATETLETGKIHRRVEATYELAHDGDRRQMHVLVSSTPLDLPRDDRVLVCIEDVSEPKRTQEALQKAHDELEKRVESRTAHLAAVNRELQQEIAEHRDALERVRLLSSVVKQSSEGIAVADMDGHLLFVNEAFARIHGYAAHELIGKHLRVFHVEEQMPAVERANRILRETGEFSGEIWHVRRDGQVFPTLMHNSLLRDESGNPVGMIGTIRDITELKRVENQVRAERDLAIALTSTTRLDEGLRRCLSAAIEISDMDCGGIYLVDETSGALHLACDQGLSPEFINAVSRFPADSANAQLVQKGESVFSDVRMLGLPPTDEAARKEKLHAAAVLPLLHDNHAIACMNVGSHWLDEVPQYARDALELVAAQSASVIARLKSERALAESEERYRLLAENATDVIWTCDLDFRCTYVSPSVESMKGHTVEEVIRQTLDEVFVPASAALIRKMVAETLAAAEEEPEILRQPITVELEENCKDGSTVWTEVNASFLLGDDGGPIGIIGVTRDITERKRMEEALRETEQRYREIVDNVQDAVFTIALDGTISFLNPAWEAITGLPRADWVGRSFVSLVHSDDRSLTTERFETASRGESPAPYQMRFKTGSDEYKIGHFVIAPRFKDGEAVAVVGICRDITEHKWTEEELSRKAAVLQAINDVFRETLTCETEEQLGKACLAVAERLTGSEFGFLGELNREGLMDTIAISNPGWDACNLAVSDARYLTKNMPLRGIDRSTLREERSRIVNQEQIATHPDRLGVPDGHPPITAFLGVPLKHQEKTIGMIGLGNKPSGYDANDEEAVKDLSVAIVEALRNKRTEASQAKSEQKFRGLAERSFDLVFMTDAQGVITYVSPATRRILSAAPDEVIGRHFIEFLAESEVPRVSQLFAQRLKGKDVGIIEMEVIAREGKRRFVELNSALVMEGSEAVGTQGVIRDVTNRKLAEEQLREREKELVHLGRLSTMGEMAAGIAHELKQPLCAITNYATATSFRLQDATADSQELTDLLEKISAQSQRASDIINRLRGTVRKCEPRRSSTDMNELLNDLLKLVEHELRHEGVSVNLDMQENLPFVFADAIQIQQVVLNLIRNAVDAMRGSSSKQRQLTLITSVTDNDAVETCVGDNGIGLSEEIRGKMFDAFFTTKPEGLGMGLAISRTIVEAHEGRIWAAPNSPRGTMFRFVLPTAKGVPNHGI